MDGLEAVWKEQTLILNNEIFVVTQVVLHVDSIAFTYISFTPAPLSAIIIHWLLCLNWYLALLLWVIIPQ